MQRNCRYGWWRQRRNAEKIFEDQLKRLDKEYVDFYLLHALDKERFEKVKKLGLIEMCEKFRQEGKIRYLGFSFHDDYEVFEEIINSYDWDFCQIQYNYMDTMCRQEIKAMRWQNRRAFLW